MSSSVRLIASHTLLALWASVTHAQWIPIGVRDGAVTFPVVVEGVETTAALDTGSSVNSVDAAFAERIGLSLSGPRYQMSSAYLGGKIVPSEAQLDVQIFGVKVVLKDTPAMVHPSSPLLIGVDFLREFVLQIDYPGSRMRILPRSAIDLADRENVPLRDSEGTCDSGYELGFVGRGTCPPAVQVVFPGDEKIWLLLDTGATGPIVLNRLVAERHGWLVAYRKSTASSVDALGKVIETEMLVMPSLRLGPFELGDVPVAVPSEEFRVLTGRGGWGRVETGTHITRGARANGLLGYDVLRHFVVTIDYERELLHVAPPAPERSEPGRAEPPE